MENRGNATFCRHCGISLDEQRGSSETDLYTQLQPGVMLDGKYKILRDIGESGLGSVYLATDGLGRRYAVKQIRDDPPAGSGLNEDTYIRSFQREAHILSSLPHPYLPIARDFIPDSRLIVMDFIEGVTLAEIMDASVAPLPESRVLRWSIQVCEALSYLHQKVPPIIHRNIKPKNIILEEGESDRVRLLGFGLARYYIDGKDKDEDCLGTPGYSPPEQYGLAQTDSRSDVFGLGVTMFALLSKCDPGDFVEMDESDNLKINFPDLAALNPAVSQNTNSLVMKAIQINPADRYPTADDMKKELESILRVKHTAAPIDRFVLNKPVPVEETRYYEFKEIFSSDPKESIRRIVDKYTVAFLNSDGGRIYWGIRDHDRCVVGVKVNYSMRDDIRQTITNKLFHIQPSVSQSAYGINFYQVHDGDRIIEGLYIIELVIFPPQPNLLYFTGTGEVYVKTEAGKKRLSGAEIHDELILRLQKGYGYIPAPKNEKD